MWSCLFFMKLWAGKRFLSREGYILAIFGWGVQVSVSAVPFGPGIDFWRSCRFIGGL